jgi:hypothetical protein
LKYIRNDLNNILQRATQIADPAKVAQCKADLETFISQHSEQEAAIWLLVLDQISETLMNKTNGVQDAVIVEAFDDIEIKN